MKLSSSVALLLCLIVSVAVPVARGQACTGGLVRVCVTPLVCVCLLPGGGSADPILTDFVGNKFEFLGEPNSFYNLYSDNAHQVNMGLFPGFVDGHDGTYMGDFGIAYHDFRVNVSLLEDGDIRVETWQESNSEIQQKHTVLASGDISYRTIGEKNGDILTLATEPYRPYHGRAVDIVSGILEMSIWSVPAGTEDSKGVKQPAYLNFNLTLLAPPAGNQAEGIIGETLAKAVELHKEKIKNLFAESAPATTQTESNTFDGKGLLNDYRVDSLFGTDFLFNRFGVKPAKAAVSRRSLIASSFAGLAFPMRGTSA